MPKAEISFITPELQKVLDSVPEQNNPRSRLDPFKPYILRWRRQGKTYRRIAEILTNECKVSVSHKGVYKFVKLAARPRKPQPEIDLELATVQPVAAKGRLSAEERQARIDFVRSLNSKTDVNEEQPKTGWDELEPENVSYKPQRR